MRTGLLSAAVYFLVFLTRINVVQSLLPRYKHHVVVLSLVSSSSSFLTTFPLATTSSSVRHKRCIEGVTNKRHNGKHRVAMLCPASVEDVIICGTLTSSEGWKNGWSYGQCRADELTQLVKPPPPSRTTPPNSSRVGQWGSWLLFCSPALHLPWLQLLGRESITVFDG